MNGKVTRVLIRSQRRKKAIALRLPDATTLAEPRAWPSPNKRQLRVQTVPETQAVAS